MSLNPTINQIPDGNFNPPNFSNFAAVFPGPTLSTEWASLPTASGGTATFPAFGGYTPTAYNCPTTNAPSGKAGWVGWQVARLGGFTYPLNLTKGQTYTLTFQYAGDSSRSTLNWYLGAWVTTFANTSFGDLRIGGNYWTNFQGSVGSGWLTKTITFVADSSGAATLTVVGGGTDGTITSGSSLSFNISGSPTVMAPVLIGGLSFTNQSAGARGFPPGSYNIGNSANTVVAGNDPRLSYLDGSGLRHPRMVERDLATSAGLGVATTAPPLQVYGTSAFPGVIKLIAASVNSVSGSGSLTVDVLLGGVSIFTGGQSPITITTASASTVGCFRSPYTQITAASQLTFSVLSLGGFASVTGLAMTFFIDYS